MADVPATAWRKSSRSGPNGCVEVAVRDGAVVVRDSKDKRGPVLMFTFREWDAFLSGAGNGEFDLARLAGPDERAL